MGSEYKKVISDKKNEAGKLMTSKQLSECNVAIHTASVAAAASGAIPLPGVDAVPISAAQITMVLALGKIFDQKLTESAAKGIIGAAASTFVGRNIVKLIPIAGWVVSAAVAAGVTEAIGWSIAVDFAKTQNKEDSRREDEFIDDEDNNEGSSDESAHSTEGQNVNDEDPDDESIAKDFDKAFGEEEE